MEIHHVYAGDQRTYRKPEIRVALRHQVLLRQLCLFARDPLGHARLPRNRVRVRHLDRIRILVARRWAQVWIHHIGQHWMIRPRLVLNLENHVRIRIGLVHQFAHITLLNRQQVAVVQRVNVLAVDGIGLVYVVSRVKWAKLPLRLAVLRGEKRNLHHHAPPLRFAQKIAQPAKVLGIPLFQIELVAATGIPGFGTPRPGQDKPAGCRRQGIALDAE